MLYGEMEKTFGSRHIVYKSDYFSCTFSSLKKFNEKLQEKLDAYAAEGWRLHSYQVPGELANFCTMVFYREED